MLSGVEDKPRRRGAERDVMASAHMVCSGVGPAYIKMSPPRAPVRHGDEPPDFSEISQRLDETRQRLEKLRADLRAVRGRK